MPAGVAIAPPGYCPYLSPRMTMTVVVAQAGTPSTPDLSESRVPTYDPDLDLDGEGKHASGCNEMPDPWSRIELEPSHVSGGPCRGWSRVSHPGALFIALALLPRFEFRYAVHRDWVSHPRLLSCHCYR